MFLNIVRENHHISILIHSVTLLFITCYERPCSCKEATVRTAGEHGNVNMSSYFQLALLASVFLIIWHSGGASSQDMENILKETVGASKDMESSLNDNQISSDDMYMGSRVNHGGVQNAIRKITPSYLAHYNP